MQQPHINHNALAQTIGEILTAVFPDFANTLLG